MDMEPFELETSDVSVEIGLVSTMDIHVCSALKETFLEALPIGKEVVIDASRVDRMSTPCIQVLLSAAKTMTENDQAFALRQPSEEFVTAFNELGLFPVLMKWKIQT